LLGDVGVLIDQRDLERPVDELLLGKLIDNQLAIVGRIAARGEPCDHVVAAACGGDKNAAGRSVFSFQAENVSTNISYSFGSKDEIWHATV
jgi:hypothetical protein